MAKKKYCPKHLIKGRFYHFHEGSPKGHPGMVFWKCDKRNLYLALTTDSSNGEHRTKLTTPTSNDISKSFVYNRPLLAKRKDIGGHYPNMKFSKKDKVLLKNISRRNYRETRSIKSKDRRYFKKLRKKPKY